MTRTVPNYNNKYYYYSTLNATDATPNNKNYTYNNEQQRYV